MKVLASCPNELARLRDIKRDLAFLATCGSDWTEYSKRLGAAFPSLDIFSLGFVQRYSFGWRLTARGAIALEMMEESARATVRGMGEATAPDSVRVDPSLSDVEEVGGQSEQPASPADRRARFTVVEGGQSKAA
ncbi:hypothetical protein BST63_04735 [Bradyrhizobium canariense]|uniref:Uncharacterized protein n=1 Tax=Bradyrhizobium canariense TaxID=255045 RepID=A0ABX3X9D4_9BRAD|nr:hypothetical protein [Bradyrhizobium canariense]OSJ18840.1 hypothetical protein BSR47_05175 [Bradyrhizobium canariense]OSJ33958.1 hypothetical protein BST63_04735 [Bradyrhizobium canariense]